MYTEANQNMKAQTSVRELKQRLDWGEPALTIIDSRERNAFNTSRIMGAISFPESDLVARAMQSLEMTRDIYIYNSTDEKTAESAQILRDAGYQNVFELNGGLAAWKALGYPIEGNPAVIA